MCEILVKAVDARMPTVSEWRAQLQSRLPAMEKFLSEYADVPAVEADHERLVEYEQAVSMLASGLAREAKAGKAVLKAQQKLNLAAKINDYQAAPLTKEAIAKARLYCAMPWERGDDKAPTISERWHYFKHQVDVEAKRKDDDKAAELALKDRQGCYKTGDPVVVMPDDHEWGYEEGPPKFIVIKIPGMSVAEAQEYALIETFRPLVGEKEIVRKRAFSIDLADLSHGAVVERSEFNKRVSRKPSV